MLCVETIKAWQLMLHHLVRGSRGWVRLTNLRWSVDHVEVYGVDVAGVGWARTFRRGEHIDVITSAMARDIRRIAAQLPPEE